MDKPSFFALLLPYAKRLQAEGSPIFPSVRLAQSWHETGGTIPAWNNLGGYKAGSGTPNQYWNGQVVEKKSWEVIGGQRVTVTATFRAYDSIYLFYKDQDLLFQRSRYTPVRLAATPNEQAQMLLQCGYATDPAYALKLIAIMEASNLYQYDAVIEGDEPMTAEEKAAFEALQEQVASLMAANELLTDALSDQTDALKELQLWALDVDGQNRMDKIPAWAQAAVDAAVRAKLIDTPTDGSYDFYRILTVLHRKKLI
ncbi:glycoside hydrolase family 73 protein [Paenibacillus silvisoli]|uniref:glycoside hydrolase family 73 protein n=1 Tax=Paenibacillus silvisoli TaxID=3110539 RepID=UPI0028056919|nr:glucosaminidase domain-containing protein [Paenibacillus silvisoli]